MKDALDTSVTALLRMQVQDENVPLKKISDYSKIIEKYGLKDEYIVQEYEHYLC